MGVAAAAVRRLPVVAALRLCGGAQGGAGAARAVVPLQQLQVGEAE